MLSTIPFFCPNLSIKLKLFITIFALANMVIESSTKTFTEPLHLRSIQYNLDVKVDFEDRKIVA